MNFEIIEFEKSVEERLEEYLKIHDQYSYEADDDFRIMWSSYLANTIEPVGWFAVWKIPKLSCFQYDVPFSSLIPVKVKEVCFETLTAEIEIIECSENRRFNHLPQKLLTNLIDLFVVNEQDNSVLFTTATAECLDQYRIFYKYLWWPWEADESSSEKWFYKNLQSRINLYNNILEGNYNEDIIKKLKTLIEKGKFYYDIYLKETKMVQDDDEGDDNVKKKIVQYMKNIELIKGLLDDFTEPKWMKLFNCGQKQNKTCPEAFLIVPKCTLRTIIDCTREMVKYNSSLKLKRVVEKLEEAFTEYENYDVIFLSSGIHNLSNECLNVNVTIKSSMKESSTIQGISPYWYLLKTTADNICLENLIIYAEKSQVIIYVKEGITYLNSVIMMGSLENKQKAIIVKENATLVANKCQFNNFNIAITCLPGSAVQLIDCVFQNNQVALEVVNDAQLCLSNTSSINSKNTFIRYHNESDDGQSNEIQSLETLINNVPTISVEYVKIDDEERAVKFV